MERDENKLSYRQAGVGNIEIGLVEDQCAVEKDVEVKSAGSVLKAGRAIAAEITLDLEKGVEQSSGGKSGFQSNHGIDETRLIGETDGLRGVKGGATGHAANGVESLGSGG